MLQQCNLDSPNFYYYTFLNQDHRDEFIYFYEQLSSKVVVIEEINFDSIMEEKKPDEVARKIPRYFYPHLFGKKVSAIFEGKYYSFRISDDVINRFHLVCGFIRNISFAESMETPNYFYFINKLIFEEKYQKISHA
jgi:hypothetical protein